MHTKNIARQKIARRERLPKALSVKYGAGAGRGDADAAPG